MAGLFVYAGRSGTGLNRPLLLKKAGGPPALPDIPLAPSTPRDFLRDKALTETSILKGERYINPTHNNEMAAAFFCRSYGNFNFLF